MIVQIKAFPVLKGLTLITNTSMVRRNNVILLTLQLFYVFQANSILNEAKVERLAKDIAKLRDVLYLTK